MPDVDALAPYGWDAGVAGRLGGRDPAGVGRVVRVERSEVDVMGVDGLIRSPVEQQLAVGDWVLLDGDRVTEVVDRSSALTRPDPSGAGVQVLAANVDLVVVTAPVDRLTPARVEREILAGWASGAVPLVAVTKADLGDGSEVAALRRRLAGVDVLELSARSGAGVDELAARLLPARTAVLLGPSGAGKSTLTNALVGADVQATGAVREGDARGRHTTSRRQLLLVASGGVVIDTPGLRGLAVADDRAIDETFPDLAALVATCRFSDCRHDAEPGCAIIAALASGRLDPARLGNWAKLRSEASEGLRRAAADHRVAEQRSRTAARARASAAASASGRQPRRPPRDGGTRSPGAG